jgi:hypothetical protein
MFRPLGHLQRLVQLEGCQLKNPMTSSGIEPATFQLVAQCFIQLSYHDTVNNLKSSELIPPGAYEDLVS